MSKKILINLAVITIVLAILLKTVMTDNYTEKIIYSGNTESWSAQYIVYNYPNMKSKEYMSLSYKGDRSDIHTKVTVKYKDSFGYFEGTRVLPRDKKIYFGTGSSYTYHGPVIDVLVKWNETEQEFNLTEAPFSDVYDLNISS